MKDAIFHGIGRFVDFVDDSARFVGGLTMLMGVIGFGILTLLYFNVYQVSWQKTGSVNTLLVNAIEEKQR